jgi:Ca2+-binding EF-hand superfamily protein
MQEKFGVYWNSKVQELSKAKYVGNEGVPGATRIKKSGGIKLFALKKKGQDINEVLRQCIDDIWNEYDTDGSGVLEKPEAKLFVTGILKSLGINNGLFSDADFETCYRDTDTDGNGVISKDEMRDFIKNVAGL